MIENLIAAYCFIFSPKEGRWVSVVPEVKLDGVWKKIQQKTDDRLNSSDNAGYQKNEG